MCLAVVPAASQRAGAATAVGSPRLSAEQRSAVLSLLQTLDGGGASAATSGASSTRSDTARPRKNRKKVRATRASGPSHPLGGGSLYQSCERHMSRNLRLF